MFSFKVLTDFLYLLLFYYLFLSWQADSDTLKSLGDVVEQKQLVWDILFKVWV